MRKKLLSKTYLRNVKEYTLKFDFTNPEFYISVKKIIKTEEPLISSTGLFLINNNYYLLELIPKNENYAMRVFFNENKERLGYYFDISLGNGLDEEIGIPYYDDLFTDITIINGRIEVIDEDELMEALKNNQIRQEDYDLANDTRDKLLKEIKNNVNKYINMDLESYL